jgi:beta-lactamase superfamily II metal-dependent hydrolase
MASLAVMLAALAATSMPARAAGSLRLDFFDVGQGDAALVTSPSGKTVLIDGGPREAAVSLAAAVRARTSKPLDLVILTHRHADHLGGLATVIGQQGALQFMDAAFPHPSPAYTALLQALAARHIPVREATRGRKVDLGGGATLLLLSPPEPAITGSRSDVNANSVVIRVTFGATAVLFTGDAEAATEKWLMSSGADLRARVLKVAHHGGRYSSSARFLDAVAPEVAVVSAGAGNEYGHPAPATLARLARLQVHVYRTDVDGSVTVQSDGQRIEIHTARKP